MFTLTSRVERFTANKTRVSQALDIPDAWWPELFRCLLSSGEKYWPIPDLFLGGCCGLDGGANGTSKFGASGDGGTDPLGPERISS